MKFNIQKFKDGGESKKNAATFGLPEVNIYPQNEFGDIARSQGINRARNWKKVKEGTTKGINDFYNDPRTQMVMAGLPLPGMLDAAGDAIKVVGPIIKNSKIGQATSKTSSAAQSGVKNILKKKVFIKEPDSFTRGIGTSEIDWGKWNKEIPQNKELLNEYNEIEKFAKESGNWMKNPDGTNFKGTPEQFVQQNSSNFKKAFPNPILDDSNNIQINYHGTKAKNLKKFRKYNELEGWFGTGTYTTPDKNYALGYTRGMSDEDKVLQLYINSNSPQKTIINPFKGNFSKEELTLQPGYDYLKVSQEQVTPFSNYLKSAIGNNGMFDMTNPNIYKSLIGGAFLNNLINNLKKEHMK